MKRRGLLSSLVGALSILSAGCSQDSSTQPSDRTFEDFRLINERRAVVTAAIEITRNGETVLETDIEVPAADEFGASMIQIIDRLDHRTGTFEVTVSTRDDEVTVPVTKDAGGKDYILIVIIESDGSLVPFLSQ